MNRPGRRFAWFVMGIAAAFPLEALVASPPPRPVTLEQRVAAQRAIEEVYWRHRLWPEQNPGAKPALSSVLPERLIVQRAEDGVRMSLALERLWRRPITAAHLQAELRRMARETRKPEVLAELFAALGNEPTAVAEHLARPLLAGRLLRTFYQRDRRVHGVLRAQAESERRGVAGVAHLKALGGAYDEIEWALEERPDRPANLLAPDGARRVGLPGAEWRAKLEELSGAFGVAAGGTLPVGTASGVLEDDARFFVVAILSRGQDRVRVATVSWAKEPFEEWWARTREGMTGEVAAPAAEFTLPGLAVSCADDTWAPIPQGLPGARYGHSAVWTGSEMIVWGGEPLTNTGARYDPVTDTWTAMSVVGAPSPRSGPGAVWTGSEMIVWGASAAGSVDYRSGGRYNPATDAWTATTTVDAPTPRSAFTTVWAGSRMIVWGGYGCLDVACSVRTYLDTGGVYDPVNDSWAATSTAGAPSPRRSHTAVSTGARMIVWGGWGCQNPSLCSLTGVLDSGGVYDPATDSWTATNTTGAPSPRAAYSVVWTGTEMVIWGGFEIGIGYLSSGGRYSPGTDSWAPTTATGAPTARDKHSAVWTGSEMVVWGGYVSGIGFADSGGRYAPATDSWTPTATTGAPAPRDTYTAVWTGTELIVFGGWLNSAPTDSGARYSPASDTWVPTSASFSPLRRFDAAAVWTGSEMIVWGGTGFTVSGGRYDPATATWFALPIPCVTMSGDGSRAVWSGTEMIVWGGESYAGGRYNPGSDSWTVTTAVNAPAPRRDHAAVWDGVEMIVWGGEGCTNPPMCTEDGDLDTGGRYDPLIDSWRTTSVSGAPRARSRPTGVWIGGRAVVWGGWWYDGGTYHYEDTGGLYDPVSDTWLPTTTEGAPSARAGHTAVGTGREMIVWGGAGDETAFDTGGRYQPDSDTWHPTSALGAPSPRSLHTAVWTGGEMIVWGGADAVGELGGGGRYMPLADAWIPMSSLGEPPPRLWHSAVWAGSEMLVWGGLTLLNGPGFLGDGGRYCASPHGAILVSPGDVDFGRVVSGTASTRTVTVTSVGSANVPIFTVSLPAAPFAKTADACTGQTLPPGASCSVTFVVTPPSVGAFASQAQISSGSAIGPLVTVPLQALGVDVLMTPVALWIDDASGNANGVLEPGESAGLAPSWRNDGIATAPSVAGTLSTSDAIALPDATASYGDIAPGEVKACSAAADCYEVLAGGSRPELHWDVAVHEALSTGDSRDRTLHIGASFADVAPDAFGYRYVETVLHHGITAGCGGALYCPADDISRWQMAVLLATAMAGGKDAVPSIGTVPGVGVYDCRPGGVSVFADIEPSDSGCRFIHLIAARGVTAGCGGSAYCPSADLSRWQAAVFLATAMAGTSAAVPSAGTVAGFGDYDCVSGGSSVFGDVPAADPGCKFIHYLAAHGVTAGCGGGNYCPSVVLRRDQMAVLVTRAFSLELVVP